MHGHALAQVKEEGWWLVLGDAQTNELHAVKRTSFGARASARLAFEAGPGAADAPPPGLTLFLVSRGVDICRPQMCPTILPALTLATCLHAPGYSCLTC